MDLDRSGEGSGSPTGGSVNTTLTCESGSPRYQALIAARRKRLQAEVDAWFRPPADVLLEIGCGHGHFLAAYAQAHPDCRCAGIDIVGERIERATRKRDRGRLQNLVFFHAEARLFLEVLSSRVRLKTVFLLFPDPWPKLRHQKNRIFQSDFLRVLARHSAPDCRLHYRTDHRPYFESARRTAAGDPHWDLVEESWPFEFATVFQGRATAHDSFTVRRRSPYAAGPLRASGLTSPPRNSLRNLGG
jgi:tRNA (guanine-N7-)-methyltransferase